MHRVGGCVERSGSRSSPGSARDHGRHTAPGTRAPATSSGRPPRPPRRLPNPSSHLQIAIMLPSLMQMRSSSQGRWVARAGGTIQEATESAQRLSEAARRRASSRRARVLIGGERGTRRPTACSYRWWPSVPRAPCWRAVEDAAAGRVCRGGVVAEELHGRRRVPPSGSTRSLVVADCTAKFTLTRRHFEVAIGPSGCNSARMSGNRGGCRKPTSGYPLSRAAANSATVSDGGIASMCR